MAGPQVFVDILDETLKTVQEAFRKASIELPERQYVNWDPQMTWDCDQLVVNGIRGFTGMPGREDLSAETPGGGKPRGLAVDVWLIRCVPRVSQAAGKIILPEPDELKQKGRERAIDAACLWFGLIEAYHEGGFLELHQAVVIGHPVAVKGGGFGGSRLSMLVQR